MTTCYICNLPQTWQFLLLLASRACGAQVFGIWCICERRFAANLKLLKLWRRKLEKMGIINPCTISRKTKDWLTLNNSTKSNTYFCQYTISVVCSLYFQMKSFLAANKNSPERLLRSSPYCPRNGDCQSLRLAGKCVFTGNSNRCFFSL